MLVSDFLPPEFAAGAVVSGTVVSGAVVCAAVDSSGVDILLSAESFGADIPHDVIITHSDIITPSVVIILFIYVPTSENLHW